VRLYLFPLFISRSAGMLTVWVNKSAWRKPGPIVYMGLLNAFAFAWNGIETQLFLRGNEDTDTDRDLVTFYGLDPDPLLTIHTIGDRRGLKRPVYKAAIKSIRGHLEQGERVLAITRELGLLPALIRLRRDHPKLRVLHEVHDYYANILHLPQRTLSAYRRSWAERTLFPKLDAVICLTEYQRALYQQWFPDLPIIALPLGTRVMPPMVDLSARRRLRRVLYIGHLHGYKGLQRILDLGQRLDGTNIRLACYGGHSPQVAKLREMAANAGLRGTLQFEPFVTPAQLSAVLDRQTSIGLVPLQDTFYSRYLTCPVKALDFLSHGIPIVGSDLPSVRDVVRHHAVLVPSDDTEAFASAITDLLDQPQRYDTYSRASYQRAAELTWSKRARCILTFLDRCTRVQIRKRGQSA
jgi:glycosyltransferase involved in cell wall biosynthesis